MPAIPRPETRPHPVAAVAAAAPVLTPSLAPHARKVEAAAKAAETTSAVAQAVRHGTVLLPNPLPELPLVSWRERTLVPLVITIIVALTVGVGLYNRENKPRLPHKTTAQASGNGDER